MNKVACIGSRATPAYILTLMEKIGAYLVSHGYVVSSGNAVGADQAFARGANRVKPAAVHLYLPWKSYEEHALLPGNKVYSFQEPRWFDLAAKHHPNWDNLKDSVRKLMARNIGIVENSSMVICWMDPSQTGGTGHGVRYADSVQIPVLNLYKPDDLKRVMEQIK